MPKILIKVEGGGAYGLGHVSRSLELATALEHLGGRVMGFLCNADAVSRARIQAAGASYEILEFRSTNTASLLKAVDRESADLLVVDQPTDLTKTIHGLRRERPGIFMVALDPPVSDPTAFDVIVNLFSSSRSPGLLEGIGGYYEGLDYAILRPEFLASRSIRNGTDERVRDLLVCFGGTDPQRLTLKVLRSLRTRLSEELNLHVVIGPGFTFKDEVREAARWMPMRLKLYEDLQDMAELMANCDLGITGAGTTVLEMCCVGCPAIVIAQNQAERRFATSLNDRGVVRYLGMAGQVTEAPLLTEIDQLLADHLMRRQLAKRSRALIDGRGAPRTADLILREFAKRASR